MIPRYGEPIKSGMRYRQRTGAYAVLGRDGQVLLTHQLRPVDEFQLPGGGVDTGESHIQALHREVLEETGWSISSPTKLGVFRRFTYMPDYDIWAEKICHIYFARPVLRMSDPVEPFHSAVWTTRSEAIDAIVNEGDAHFLWRALTSRKF